MSFLCRFKEIAAKSKEELVSLGFPALTIEDFHDVVCTLVIDVICNSRE